MANSVDPDEPPNLELHFAEISVLVFRAERVEVAEGLGKCSILVFRLKWRIVNGS